MKEIILEKMAKQFILGVRNSITPEQLIVKRPVKLKNVIELARLYGVAGRTARSNPPPSNKNVFVPMLFRNSNNWRTRNNFESSGSNNFNRNNFYNQKNINENFNNYNARIDFGSGQAQAHLQPQTCFKCGKLGHLANACWSEPLNMAGLCEPNEKPICVNIDC